MSDLNDPFADLPDPEETEEVEEVEETDTRFGLPRTAPYLDEVLEAEAEEARKKIEGR